MGESISQSLENDFNILDDLIAAKTGQRELEIGETKPTTDQILDFVRNDMVPKLKGMSADERAQAKKDIGTSLDSLGVGFQFED
jgi:hypothetical protein